MNGASATLRPMPSTEPAALAAPPRNWVKAIGPILSIAVLAVVFHHVRRADLASELRRLPLHPVFWALFLLSYCSTPLAEWLIYRRLWLIPANGFLALLRKQISNELLFDYLGEIHFYAWARQRVGMTNAPFGAIKDIAIVSAICGSLITLLMLPFGGALLQALSFGGGHILAISSIIVGASFVIPFLLWPRLFSLPLSELCFIARVQMGRIALIILLSALMWHMVLPGIAFAWWLMLAAIRQLVSRLPLIANKDVLFIGVTSFFLGRQEQIADLMLMLASLTVILHLMLGAVMSVGELIAARRQSC
jgi:hypothetical protein